MSENDNNHARVATDSTPKTDDSIPANPKADVEAQRHVPTSATRQPPYWRLVFDQAMVTDAVLAHQYLGSGTDDDPYLVEWIPNDPRNPMRFKQWQKWFITITVAVATLAVAFVSSAYSGGVEQILQQFGCSQEVVTLGISLFVVGFAIGPLLWAPLSEMFGRQVLFITTYGALTAFNAGAAGAQNIQTLLILRFFAGAFGSSPLTNAGGSIADMFAADQRGLAMSIFAAAPFMGPVLGPIVGGFLGETEGWRWVEGLMAIFSGVLWIAGALLIPETYAPVLLRKRAAKLSKITGKVYRSKLEAVQGKLSIRELFGTALSRPWILLFKEPIVMLLSIYMAIIYGTLYMMFGAFPIVFQEGRGWSEGIGGLPFIGVAVGMLSGVALTIPYNKKYIKIMKEHKGFAPPEARLPTVMIGACAIPIGLFWFAWTNSPSIHWASPVIASAPFGFGMVLVFLGCMNYLIDSYTIFAASVLAANSVLRSLFGAAFPLFTTQMFTNIGIHWGATIPAFLALACVPFPFILYKYGHIVREKCSYAKEAAEFMKRIQASTSDGPEKGAEARAGAGNKETGESGSVDSDDSTTIREGEEERREHQEYERELELGGGNPFDIDRVNSRETFSRVQTNRSFKSTKSKR